MSRRAAAWLLTLAAVAAQEAAPRVPPPVHGVGVTVRDLDASIRFYTEVLSFRVVDRQEREGTDEERLQGVFGLHTVAASLQLGDERLELTEFLAPRGRAMPETSRSNDRWFQHIAILVSDMDRAYAHLRAHHVAHSSPSPQTLPAWNQAAGGIRAFYFQDPDGHALEVLWFPPGKGDAKWHGGGERLFLGIDHTAIVVADTDASLRFWRDELGLRVAGGSENYGTEQERLNNVFGARLRITTLRGSSGPGVELLEYLTPRTGRAYPVDTAANDLWHWTVHVGAIDLEAQWRRLAANGAAIAAGVIRRDGASCTLVRDPDGHRALLAAAPAPAR